MLVCHKRVLEIECITGIVLVSGWVGRCNFVINIIVVPYIYQSLSIRLFDCKYIVCVILYCCHSFVRCICLCSICLEVKEGVLTAVKEVSANSNRSYFDRVCTLSKNICISIYVYVCQIE